MIDVEKRSITDQAIRSVKWSGFGGLLPRLITPVSTLILAALLTPADFGIVAVCMSVISFAQIVVELGIGKAIIQRRADVPEAASVAFLLNMSLAVTMCALLWLAAPWFARMYGIQALTGPLRITSFALILSGLISIPNALLTRAMSFRLLFYVSVLPQIATAGASVGLALYHADYWALIMGYLIGNVIQTIVIWAVCSWRPKLILNFGLAKSIMSFGFWILLSNLLTWVFLYADNLLAGYFLGPGSLGVYSLGFNLANLLPGMLVSMIAAVAYPAFSALQGDRIDVGESLVKLQSLVAVLVFPVCFGLSVVGPRLVNLFYGNNWQGLSTVILFLSIMPGLSHLWSLNAEAYRAVGRPDIWTKAAFLALLIFMPLLVLIGQMRDLRAFVIVRFLGACLLPSLNILYAKTTLGLSFSRQWWSLRAPLIGASLMSLLVLVLSQSLNQYFGLPDWKSLLVVIPVGALCYFAVIRGSDRDLWNSFWLLASRAARVN